MLPILRSRFWSNLLLPRSTVAWRTPHVQKVLMYSDRPRKNTDRSALLSGRLAALDTIASIPPMERSETLAEMLTDQDVETLRHLVNQGTSENTLRALTADLAYLQAWPLAATGGSLPWPAPEARGEVRAQ